MDGPISALGQKQPFAPQKVMSALPSKADMCGATSDVCFGPKADISSRLASLRIGRIVSCQHSEFEYGQGYSEVVQPDQRVRIYSTLGRRWEVCFRSHLGR